MFTSTNFFLMLVSVICGTNIVLVTEIQVHGWDLDTVTNFLAALHSALALKGISQHKMPACIPHILASLLDNGRKCVVHLYLL